MRDESQTTGGPLALPGYLSANLIDLLEESETKIGVRFHRLPWVRTYLHNFLQ